MKKLLLLALVAVAAAPAHAADALSQTSTSTNPADLVGAGLLAAPLGFVVYKHAQDTQDGVRYDIMFGYAEEHPVMITDEVAEPAASIA